MIDGVDVKVPVVAKRKTGNQYEILYDEAFMNPDSGE
jgi:hypothetical protein